MEVVDFLKHPARYIRAGAVGPKGVLMVGPPGTGKTLWPEPSQVRRGVPFLALSGSSFVEMFVGVGASRVRDLFADARKRAPAIIFIDEIDAIGGRRGPGGFGSNDEREQTLNQLLSEMDGFEPDASVVVMGATNRAEILDTALLRPGRFDRTVEIPLPNQTERTAILAIHGRGKQLGPDVDLDAVSRGTPGFSGADLANLVNEAAINAVRGNRHIIRAIDFDAARDRLLIGRRDASNALLPEEKRSVAVHEAGHALVAILSEHADPVAKVTILPRGAALGVTEQLPESERHLYPRSYLTDSLAVRLGGRAAEIIVIGEPSTGASNDLAGATDLATRMVREWGFSIEVGPIGYGPEGPSRDNPFAGRPYSEETQRSIDQEVARLLREAEVRATQLLSDHLDTLNRVVDLLLERETVDGSDLAAIVGSPKRVTEQAGAVVPRAVAMTPSHADDIGGLQKRHVSRPGASFVLVSARTSIPVPRPYRLDILVAGLRQVAHGKRTVDNGDGDVAQPASLTTGVSPYQVERFVHPDLESLRNDSFCLLHDDAGVQGPLELARQLDPVTHGAFLEDPDGGCVCKRLSEVHLLRSQLEEVGVENVHRAYRFASQPEW